MPTTSPDPVLSTALSLSTTVYKHHLQSLLWPICHHHCQQVGNSLRACPYWYLPGRPPLCMCTLIDSLKPLIHLGYNLSGSKHRVHLLQYADDTCLVGNGPSGCQKFLKQVEHCLQWSSVKAKVPKFFALGIRASTGKPFDPSLTLQDQEVPFISNKPIKFLG